MARVSKPTSLLCRGCTYLFWLTCFFAPMGAALANIPDPVRRPCFDDVPEMAIRNLTRPALPDVPASETNKLAEVIQKLKSAASSGNPEAQYLLGCAYDEGVGDLIVRDSHAARRWYRQAAEQGWPEAQYALGRIYSLGLG